MEVQLDLRCGENGPSPTECSEEKLTVLLGGRDGRAPQLPLGLEIASKESKCFGVITARCLL